MRNRANKVTMTSNTFKALVLDLGEVLLLSGPNPERDVLARRIGRTPQERYDALWSERNPDARRVLTGEITEEEFWVRVGARYGFSRKESIALGGSFFHGEYLNQQLAALLRCARRNGLKTGLLSNAMGKLDNVLCRFALQDDFDDVVSSAEVGVMKPDPRIYSLICERLGVQPKEVLFIDDQALNVEAARQAGMQALRFEGEATTREAGSLLGIDVAECARASGDTRR